MSSRCRVPKERLISPLCGSKREFCTRCRPHNGLVRAERAKKDTAKEADGNYLVIARKDGGERGDDVAQRTLRGGVTRREMTRISRRWARCARHRSGGSAETQTAQCAEAACVSVLPFDRRAGRTAAGTHRRRSRGWSPCTSAAQRSLRGHVSVTSASSALDERRTLTIQFRSGSQVICGDLRGQGSPSATTVLPVGSARATYCRPRAR